MSVLGELDVIRNALVAMAAEPFTENSADDMWKAKETVTNFVDRVELITPLLMRRFAGRYATKAVTVIENNTECPRPFP